MQEEILDNYNKEENVETVSEIEPVQCALSDLETLETYTMQSNLFNWKTVGTLHVKSVGKQQFKTILNVKYVVKLPFKIFTLISKYSPIISDEWTYALILYILY